MNYFFNGKEFDLDIIICTQNPGHISQIDFA